MENSNDYFRIEKAIRFVEENFKSQPSLEEIAESVHLSKFHFDRLFKQWAGVSPKQFLQFLTLDYTKNKLQQNCSLQETACSAGLSGSSRLHDLFVNFEAVTPGEYKNKGAGLQIKYSFNPSPFGECIIATTERGICYLAFVTGQDRTAPLEALSRIWSGAILDQACGSHYKLVQSIFTPDAGHTGPFNLHLRGTNFQINVWKALQQIPEGHLVSYQDIAAHIGNPKAFRAAASAIAKNPVAYLIPCHRVISKAGAIHQYRWGTTRKKAIIGWEAARI